jgi:hypothetical protein
MTKTFSLMLANGDKKYKHKFNFRPQASEKESSKKRFWEKIAHDRSDR